MIFPSTISRLPVFFLAFWLVISMPHIASAQEAVDLAANAAQAQETAMNHADTGAAVSSESESSTMYDILMGMDVWGWLFMIVLFAFSLTGTTVAVERLVNLRQKKLIPAGFTSDLSALVQRGADDPAAFQAVCSRWPSPIAAILDAALIRAGRPYPEMEKAMEDAAAHEVAALRARIRPLSVVANVSPLLGLLGTVFGMIIAFRTTSQAGMGKAELLAEGIYLALLTTAAGLTIAIPSLLAAAYFNDRVEKLMREIDRQLTQALPCLVRMETAPFHGTSATPRPHAATLIK
jgi:biopolymer transport protein ExbB